MNITIEGKVIEAREGSSVLDAALDAGIFIPHLCSHPDLEAKGGCRLCSVEIEGVEGAVPSCMTKAEEGMKVSIHSPEAERVRKAAMELILATHPADCTGCPKYGKCELQSMYQYMGVSPERWRKKSRDAANDDSNPLISHLFTRCVRCGRCIRACRDLRGVKVLDYIKTDTGIRAGVPEGKSLKEAGCRFCGACIEVCPTGSIMDAFELMDPDKSYAENVVPCRTACPAHIDIPRFVRYIKNGEFDKAAAVIREKVPFPEVLGAVCTHSCESSCKRERGGLGESISICKLKRAAAAEDTGAWKARSAKEAPTGKRAAIIGAGPTGLTAAYYLAKKGHEVTVLEQNERAGGQCRYGIPAYRLPDELLDREIDTILETGIELKVGVKVRQPGKLLEEGYDAVLVATGTHLGARLPIEGNDLPGVYVNAEFLKAARSAAPLPVGKRVMVLGGGNVAYDCARTAKRLGAEEVHIACLENERQMTSSPEEIREGAEEGIILHSAHSFLRIVGEGAVAGVELQRVKSFSFDENRRPIVELEEGSKHLAEVDTVIFAVGQKPEGTREMGLELTHGAYIRTDGYATSLEGVFAAGDVVTGTKSVIEGIAAGREAAARMDLYLGGNGRIEEELVDKEAPDPYIGPGEGFADLERIRPAISEASQRVLDFSEIEKVLTCEQAGNEAVRCLQCDLRLNLTHPKLWNEY